MPGIAFDDKTIKPDDKLVAEKLGQSFTYWLEIQNHVDEQYQDISREWKFYGKKYGWQLKTFLKKRNLFFLIPYDSYFKIGFVFGNKAVGEIEKSEIPAFLKNEIINAKKYLEGRGLTIAVKDEQYIADITTLVKIKSNN